MNAQLKRIHCPTIFGLKAYKPNDPKKFGLLFQVMVGPEGLDAEESFDIEICTPLWLEDAYGIDDIVVGRHLLIVREYNYERMECFIVDYLKRCSAENWDEVAAKVARLGLWEFEDYVP